TIRITAAEILACAVCDLFPQTQLVAAQLTQEGFFCDFDTRQPIDEQALPLIEEKMRGLIKADLPIERREMMRENAAELFRHRHLPFKAEQALLADTPTVFVNHLGKFCDFIPGETPLLPSTAGCRSFKILEVTRDELYSEERGHYPVLRVRGTACEDLPSLKQWLKDIKAAKKRDHRVLGLQLFRPSDAICPGSWSWLPQGVELRETLLDFWKREVRSAGFQVVATPGLLKDDAGDLEFEGQFYSAFPGRAAAHAKLFAEGGYQHRDLPIRFAESAELFLPLAKVRLEGLFETRLRTSDYLHLFCTRQQVLGECISSLQFFDKTIKMLNFEPYWVLSDLRPVHSPVKQADWRQAVQLLSQGLEGAGIKAEKRSEPAGMQGPSLEMRIGDSLGRKWALAFLGTEELISRQMALSFRDAERREQAPVMLRGALFGSVERVVALLLENGVDINSVVRRAKPA
ncbi:MAG: hypothetical protein LLG04_00995, partial [Parachlamydia sp.]|nr:hypothetical protein [Parachlamydia sp.]